MQIFQKETFLKNLAVMNAQELAGWLASYADRFPDHAEDPEALASMSREIAVIEAIGEFKFPGEWREARDAA